MAAVLQCCRHLQHCQKRDFAPSTSQSATGLQQLPYAARKQDNHKHHCERNVAAHARGRRSGGGTMSDQLAELLPEHGGKAAADGAAGGDADRGSKKRRSRRRRQEDEAWEGEEEGAVEEDVEIFSLERGWIDDTQDPAAAPAGRRTSRGSGGSSSAEADGAILDEWVDNGFASLGVDDDDSDAEEPVDEETSWSSDNYNPSFWDDAGTAEAPMRSSAADDTSEGSDEDSGSDDDGLQLAWDDTADEGEDDDGWSLSAVPADFLAKKGAAQGSKAMRATEVGPRLQRLLDGMPAKMRQRLAAGADAAEAEDAATDPRAVRKAEARRKTHRRLRIISGSASGKRLLSPQGDVVRPMMEMVRSAVFSMIQAQCGGAAAFPAGSRWLDVFAGTGSIGIEALSRGCEAATFVEMDPWVARACLQPNIAACDMQRSATVLTTKAESFLERAGKFSSFGAFDFVSLCPPYLLVSYPELFQLLEATSLVKPTSIVLVEYPKRLAHEIPDTLCGLPKVRDRKYGRTFLALYAPEADADAGSDADEYWQAYE